MQHSSNGIEESPFKDMRDRKNYSESSINVTNARNKYTLPTFIEQIEWKVLSTKYSFDQKKIDIPNEQDRDSINWIINQYKVEVGNCGTIDDRDDIVQKIKENQTVIKKWSDQGFVKATLVAFLTLNSQKLKGVFSGDMRQRLHEGAVKTGYPLAYVQLGISLHFNHPEKIKQVEKLFDIGVKYGESFVYIYYGSVYRIARRSKRAYQMAKNAEINGQGAAYLLLGHIFLQGDDVQFPRNLYAAKKYLQLAKKFISKNAKAQQQLSFLNLILKNYLQNSAKIADQIVTSQEAQSKVIANFIKNKYTEVQMLNNSGYAMNMAMTNNFTSSGYHGICFKPVTFYVVFSPLLIFPSRGFLGQNSKGDIEIINIYNWQAIDPEKLKLLHKLGTKVVLNQYIRKYGANDQLPCYRIQNPYSVEIYPGSEKHFISDEKYRNFARVLFSKQLYEKAMTIYDHLIEKGAENLQIIYSNKGLIYQNTNDINQAIKWYKKSLSVKKYEKSQLRLGYIYINQGKLDEAEKICKQIQDKKERETMMDKISEKKSKKEKSEKPMSQKLFEKVNLNNVQYLKKKVEIKKSIAQNLMAQKTNPTASDPLTGDIVKYLAHYQSEISNQLGIGRSISIDQYLNEVRKVNDGAELPIEAKNLPIFNKFFKLSYRQFGLYAEGQFFEQSIGYMWFYTKEIFKKSLIQINLGIQFASSLGIRCNYLERRLEDHCIKLLKSGRQQQALQILQCAGDNVIPFCCKISQILCNQSKHEQNIQYTTKILKKLETIKQNKKVFSSMLQLSNQKIKSLIKLKNFKQATIFGEQMLQFIEKVNPQIINIKLKIEKKQSFFQSVFQGKDDFMIKQQCDALMLSFKNNIATSHYFMGEIDGALKSIDDKLVEKNKDTEKQLYFSSLLLKVKILLKKNDFQQEIKRVVQNLLQLTNKIQNLNVKAYFKAAAIKHLFENSLKNKDLKKITQNALQTAQIGNQYLSYLVKRLFDWCVKTQENSIPLMEQLIQVKILKIVYESVFERVQSYYFCKIKEGESVSQQFIEYFKVPKQPQQNNEQVSEVYQAYQDLIEQYEQIPRSEKQQRELTWQQQNNYNNLFEGFTNICQFYNGNLEYIIYFSDEMKLQKAEEAQFMISAQKMCRSERGHNGIKIMGDEARLKIKGSSRLVGNVIEKDRRKFVLFFKRQGHDDYKRKK